MHLRQAHCFVTGQNDDHVEYIDAPMLEASIGEHALRWCQAMLVLGFLHTIGACAAIQQTSYKGMLGWHNAVLYLFSRFALCVSVSSLLIAPPLAHVLFPLLSPCNCLIIFMPLLQLSVPAKFTVASATSCLHSIQSITKSFLAGIVWNMCVVLQIVVMTQDALT